MKKSFVALGCAGLFCCFGIFSIISCGEGTLDKLDKEDVFHTEHDLEVFIDMCFPPNNENKERCDSLKTIIGDIDEPSSESGGEPSSNSYVDPSSNSEVEPSSSSASITPSSSSVSTTPSSSSTPTPSSSSTPTQSVASCGGSGGGIDFTCSWSRGTVTSGKIFEPVVDVSSPEGVNCAKEIKSSFRPEGSMQTTVVTFTENEKYPTGSGDSLDASIGGKPGKFSWPVPPAKGSVSVPISVSVTCGSSCKEMECPLTLAASPTPNPEGKIVCKWPTFPSSGTNKDKYISKDAETPDCNIEGITIKNPEDDDNGANCVEIEGKMVRYEKSGSASVVGGKVVGKAVARCSGSDWTLDSVEVEVVPDPPITGTCEWDTKNNTFGGGVSAKTKAAPTVKDDYGRTCEGPYFLVDGEKRENVSAGLKVDTWDGTSQTMSKITVGATCAAGEGTERPATAINCPDITVKDPAATCEYTKELCPGTNDVTSVITAAQNNPSGGTSAGKCFYATEITSFKTGDATVNGKPLAGDNGNCDEAQDWSLPKCSTKLASVEKLDGGYYIYIGEKGWTENGFVTKNSNNGLHANCK